MMISVHFGTDIIQFDILQENFAFNLKANDFPAPIDEAEEIRRSLRHPIHTARLRDTVKKDDTVVILADDRTRMTPQDRIISLVLEELYHAGVTNDQITIMIAYGTHRPMSEQDIEAKFGRDLLDAIEIKGHDCLDPNQLVDKGMTRRGTRIFVNKDVIEADVRIGIGGVLPYHPTGWSGDAKILLPGLAGQQASCIA